MKKWNMVIDCARCHDCNDCFLADKDEFVGNSFLPYSAAQPWSGHRWINIHRKERGQHPIVQVCYLPQPCMHCDAAPCVTKAPEGAVYKREDGIVIIDPVKARGIRSLTDACPYGAIWWNEEAQLAQKCTGCAHLLDSGWTEPRCAQICPTGAIKFYSASDKEMEQIIAEEKLEAYHPEFGTNPRVLYRNLHRWQKVFVAASIAFKDTDECAEGALLTVHFKGNIAGEGAANNYGEVTVDMLEPGAKYDITISSKGYKPFTTRVTLSESINIGLVLLEKA